jgi:hypothetical protein
MKILAYTDKNKSELVTVHEALRRRRYQPDQWEKHTYYDIVKLREMTPVERGKSSSFSFKNGTSVGHGNGSKGIAHELAQQFLCLEQKLSFSLFKKDFDVMVGCSEDEAHIADPNDKARFGYVDVMLHIDLNCPNYSLFSGHIAIEITDSHKSTFRKLKLYKDLSITAIEVVIPDSWHVRNDRQVTAAQLKHLEARVRGFWASRIFVNLIYAKNKLT